LRTLTETTERQDRRALAVLARAADTRPALRTCLKDLLALLPGLSPAAVAVAVSIGYPAPLADALTSLASTAALPADLLDHTPHGTTLLGDFPVVLAQSLVKAYESRQGRENGLRGLAKTLIQLAERLGDLGRVQEALTVARRALETAERLADPLDYVSDAAESVRRATELCELWALSAEPSITALVFLPLNSYDRVTGTHTVPLAAPEQLASLDTRRDRLGGGLHEHQARDVSCANEVFGKGNGTCRRGKRDVG
jgi:hypothetical protein